MLHSPLVRGQEDVIRVARIDGDRMASLGMRKLLPSPAAVAGLEDTAVGSQPG
jgi:hypothetical protein